MVFCYPVIMNDLIQKNVDAAEVIIPELDQFNNHQIKWLSYFVCGFSRRESCRLSRIKQKTVRQWELDNPDFKAITDHPGKFRKEFDKVYVRQEYLKNFRKYLAKDEEILDTPTEELSKEEWDYLKKVRSQYTPQQLELLKDIIGDTNQKFDFTNAVLTFNQYNQGDNGTED